MGASERLEEARSAYGRRAWGDAFAALRAADEEDPLAPVDLERLAVAAQLTGRGEDAVAVIERLHLRLLGDDDVCGASRWAVWLALLHFLSGRPAQGGGWMARAERLLDAPGLDCPAQGLLRVPVALQALDGGEPGTAHQIFREVAAVGDRFQDHDLAVMGVLGQGQALVAMGEAEAGLAMLDDAMVAVTTGDVLPILSGIVYCAVIIACREVFDLRRAEEWTAVLSRWCSSQQDLKPYRGQCLVHRSEIMQLRGDWPAAMAEVVEACAHLADPPGDPVMGMAQYQLAELLRLQGQFGRAETAYREATDWGHPPHPGLALLRLAQGRGEDAAAAIRRVVAEAEGDRVRRAAVLSAHIEIMLASDDVAAAATAVEELEAIAADFDSLYLEAAAAHGRGAVCLADGDAAGACVALRGAWRCWQRLDAPYPAARARLLMARACHELGDHDTAEMELDAARRVFEALGATPALHEADGLVRPSDEAPPGGLTPRELEVLRLVATGATNRDVADDLVISEKTVARHLSNMFTKLGITSRAAATAWAYEHDVV